MLASVAEVINKEGNSLDFWKEEVGAICLLGPVTHHLLSAPRPIVTATNDLDIIVVGEIVRLTCLLLLSGLKQRFSLNAFDMAPIRAKLANMIAQAPGETDLQLEGLTLWALITSALLQSSHNRAYLLSPIVVSASKKGLLDAQDSINYAKSLLWINTLADEEEPKVAEEIEGHWNQLWTSNGEFETNDLHCIAMG
jgi:hypothetical protein